MDKHIASIEAISEFANLIGEAESTRFVEVFGRANIPNMRKFYLIIKDCKTYAEALDKLQNQRNYR